MVVNSYAPTRRSGSAVSYPSVVKGSLLSGQSPGRHEFYCILGSSVSSPAWSAMQNCAMLNVEKELPGRPNHSSSPCPSPFLPSSTGGSRLPNRKRRPSPLPLPLLYLLHSPFPSLPLLLAHYNEGAWGAL